MKETKFEIPPDHRFVQTEYVVDATSCEQHMLWEKFHQHYRVPWDDVSLGLMTTIGMISGRPVCVQVSWAFIATKRVAFLYPTSQLVDYEMVDAWRRAVFPNCKSHSDSTNFGNVVSDIGRAVGMDLIRRTPDDVWKLLGIR